MTDTLLLKERVKNTIQLGESHFREFKSALEGTESNKRPRQINRICADIGEALVAFANADGGELLIGVEDNGVITGVPHIESDTDRMLDAPRTHVHTDSILPMIAAVKIELENKIVLFFSVSKGTTEIYQLPDGRCVCRKDKSSMPEAAKRIVFDRQDIKSREYDRQFVDGANVSDLDVQFIQGIANDYLKGLSVERYLQQIGVAEYAANGLKLRMAALLLFANDIQRWHPRSQVRFMKVAGTELKSGESYNVLSDESAYGNIFKLLEESWKHLRPFLTYKTEFGADAKFEQKYIYPEWACREALVNAIAHRDYSIQNGIDVFIFDDRMEIKSPGALLSTLSINDLEELQGAHESRNALIAKVLRENKFMRELGEGMKRMFELMEESELQKPKLHSDSTWFGITLPNKSVFTTRQEEWLSMFQQFALTPLQKKIVVLGIDDREISQQDIYKAMNTNDRDTYDREVTGLRNSEILLQIRSNQAAKAYAAQRNIKRKDVPRFKVQIPPVSKAPGVVESPRELEVPIEQRHIGWRQENPKQCVFVTNFPYHMTKQDIVNLFKGCGNVEWVNLPLDYSTQMPRGFCFVWFDTPESARKAIHQLNGYKLDGRSMLVKEYTPKS